MSEHQTKAGKKENFQNVHTLNSLSLDMLNKFCFHVYAQKSLSHSYTLSLSLLSKLSLSLDILNKFCFHVYAQKSLFIAENCWGVNVVSVVRKLRINEE